jgi:hypothetical protein
MEKLEKYEIINSCETSEELQKAILAISEDNLIQGRKRTFFADRMSSFVHGVINGYLDSRFLTREFGIRQQALYIKHYTDERPTS